MQIHIFQKCLHFDLELFQKPKRYNSKKCTVTSTMKPSNLTYILFVGNILWKLLLSALKRYTYNCNDTSGLFCEDLERQFLEIFLACYNFTSYCQHTVYTILYHYRRRKGECRTQRMYASGQKTSLIEDIVIIVTSSLAISCGVVTQPKKV